MPSHTLTIELSEEAFAALQRCLDSGAYSSPAALVEEAILDSDVPEISLHPQSDRKAGAWLNDEAAAAFDELAANPNELYSPAQVRAYLAQQRHQARRPE